MSSITQVMQRSPLNIAYSCHPIRDSRMPNTFWKRFMGIHIRFVSYRREIKQWPQIKFVDAKGFRKFHDFLLKCKVSASQRWNALDTPDMFCIMESKLPRGIMERWNRSVLKIRRHQHREPNLNH